MPLKVNVAGVWKDAVPKVKVGGVWKDASSFVKAGGLWYQASSNGINVIIDSATTLYDFNLKTYMQGAGIWPASGPVVINELTVTARTYITQSVAHEVPDIEARMSTTPFRATPKGYGMVPLTASGQTLFHYYQEDTDLFPAFTTGSGWPAGSLIQKFNVLGTIYGQGADGAGTPKSYNARYEYSGGAYDSSSNFAIIVSGYLGMTLRHGYPALQVTIPIQALTVTGGVFGGGASGVTLAMYSATTTGAASGTYNPIPVSSWPDKVTAKYFIDNPFIMNDPNGVPTTSRYYGFGMGTLMPGIQSYSADLRQLIDVTSQYGGHGTGGGRGGGVGGGKRAYTPLFVTGTNSYAAGGAPLPAGDGTLSAPGAAPRSVIDFYDPDTKYGGAATTQDPNGSLDGADWGAFKALTDVKFNSVAAGLGRAPNPPTGTLSRLAAGVYPPGLQNMSSYPTNTKVFRSYPGSAILGASFVASYTSMALIRGPLA